MSVHLACKYPKKPVAGPHALAEVLDAAQQECLLAGRLGLGIVRGDINMARPPLSSFINVPLVRRPLQRLLLLAPQLRSAPCCSLALLLRAAPLLLRALARCAVLPSQLLPVLHYL